MRPCPARRPPRHRRRPGESLAAGERRGAHRGRRDGHRQHDRRQRDHSRHDRPRTGARHRPRHRRRRRDARPQDRRRHPRTRSAPAGPGGSDRRPRGVGGFEIGVAGRASSSALPRPRVPVVLDGFITGAAALPRGGLAPGTDPPTSSAIAQRASWASDRPGATGPRPVLEPGLGLKEQARLAVAVIRDEDDSPARRYGDRIRDSGPVPGDRHHARRPVTETALVRHQRRRPPGQPKKSEDLLLSAGLVEGNGTASWWPRPDLNSPVPTSSSSPRRPPRPSLGGWVHHQLVDYCWPERRRHAWRRTSTRLRHMPSASAENSTCNEMTGLGGEADAPWGGLTAD